jgi:hypothetical protein
MQGAPPGPNALRHFEQSLEALDEAPMSPEGKLALLQLVDDFVFGHSLRAAETRAWFGGGSNLARSAEALGQQLFKTGALPRTAALFAPANSRAAARHRRWLMEDGFERALAAVLDGAARGWSRATESRRRPTSRRDRCAARAARRPGPKWRPDIVRGASNRRARPARPARPRSSPRRSRRSCG